MKTSLLMIFQLIPLLLFGFQARAQFYQPIMLDPSVIKFFDPNSAFSASAEFITSTDGKPEVVPIKIAVLGNLTRVEMDITKKTGGRSSDEIMAGYLNDMKAAGSAESVSIYNPDRKCTYTILPRLKAYLQTQLPDKAITEIKQRPKAEKVELGKDKIDGHDCTRYSIKFPEGRPMDKWRTWESPGAIVWIAQDIPACPLRIDAIGSDGRTNATILIKTVDAAKVTKALFEPPSDFTKCETPGALMKIIMDHWPKDPKK